MDSEPDEIPRTYRSGPSDPVRFDDGPGTWVEIEIDRPPARVWHAVSDIELPARFSDEFLGASWLGDGPALGARFVGRNRHAAIGEWETESIIVDYEPEAVFSWAVSDPDEPGARWTFRLSPNDGATTLRFEVSLGPGISGTTMAIAAMPEKEDRIIRRRIGELHANMRATIEGIKQMVEAGE